MIVKENALERLVVEKVRGGNGEMHSKYLYKMGQAPESSPFQVIASQTLAPGCSVGFHEHLDNEELYVIVSGTGTYYDNDKENGSEVCPGDMTYTPKGQGHAITNTGKEPLVFIAVIAKK